MRSIKTELPFIVFLLTFILVLYLFFTFTYLIVREVDRREKVKVEELLFKENINANSIMWFADNGSLYMVILTEEGKTEKIEKVLL